MTLWKIDKCYYNNSNTPTYVVLPYHFRGHLKACWKWYGIKGLKWCYLFKKMAEYKARKLNKD
jgi:hypothetical protein